MRPPCLAAAAEAVNAEEPKFATVMPPSRPCVAGAFRPFAEAVAEKTGGKLAARPRHGGELGGGPVEQVDRALDGMAELAISPPGRAAQSFPPTPAAEAVRANIDLPKKERRRGSADLALVLG